MRAEIAVEAFEDSGLVYFADQQRIMEVNNTCLSVLNFIKNNTLVPEILYHFNELYGLDSEEIKNDLTALISDLITNEVVAVKCSYSEQNNIIRYKRINNVDFLFEKGKRYLIDPDSKQKIYLNSAGGFLWDKLNIPRSVSDLVTCQYAAFSEMDVDICFLDTEEYCSKLLCKGFIQEVESSFGNA